MEILHFCPSRSFSGLEQYALQLAVSQKKTGLKVGFVVCPNSPLEGHCLTHSIDVVRFDPYSFFGTFNFWSRFYKFLKSNKNLKIIHLHSTQEIYHLSIPLAVRRIMTRFLKKPKVVLQIHIWLNHKKRDPLHLALYKLVDEIWCSSTMARQALVQNLPIDEKKIKVVNYGRDIQYIDKNVLEKDMARATLGLSTDALIIGTVSRIEKSKGIRELVEAVVAIAEENQTIELAIIGDVSPKDDNAEKYFNDLKTYLSTTDKNLSRRIHFLGSKDDSFQYLNAFDLYVLPSHQECFSLSLLDAQLVQLPVVGSNSGGTPEVVKEGVTGYLFEPENVESLKSKLREALFHKENWPDYGSRASQRVRRDFDQQKVFEHILFEYENSTG